MNSLFDKPFLDRRQFLQGLAVAASVAALERSAAASLLSEASPDWWLKTMRWFQLIMVENDPGNYDPQWWFDFFRRSSVDGLCLTAGGLVAYYPSKIPYHHVSSWMKPGQDPFGDFVTECRKQNITVVARTDSHSCLNDAAEAHPEWLNIDENGKPRRHWELSKTRWITCAYGPYNWDFMTQVHAEIGERYKVDGLFCNRWQGEARGMCYCDSCKAQFREYCGLALPRGEAATSPVALKYEAWTQKRLLEIWQRWDAELRKYNPDSRYFSNTGLDNETEARIAPTHLIERQIRGKAPLWDFGRAAKESRAVMGTMPLIALSGVASSFDERVSVTSDAEQTLWLLDGVANGLRPWVLKTSAVVDDSRWVSHIERLYPFLAKNVDYMRNTSNLATIAVLLDTNARTRQGNPAPPDAMTGLYQALIEARLPFQFVYRKYLTAGALRGFTTLLIPDVKSMSDAECAVISAFVKDGGSVVASFESSLYDEAGKKRPDFGLRDILQLSYSSTESSGGNAYIRLEPETSPLLRDLNGIGKIPSTINRTQVTPLAPGFKPVFTRIPPFPRLPMEEIYPRVAKTDIPEVFTFEGKGGRVAYVPGDLEATYAHFNAVEHGILLRNLIAWAHGGTEEMSVTGPGVIDVNFWRQKNSLTVHMVNLTNPMMLSSPAHELIPIGAQTVTLKLSSGASPKCARLLVSGSTVDAKVERGLLRIQIPGIIDHELIAIDLA